MKPPPRWLLPASLCVFGVYALNYLYFFVDDEAIPYVYAQNVLHGHGLSYSVLEGRVEGYSDFLHVWMSAAVLALVNAAHVPKLTVFFIGKGISLACALALILVAWRTLGRLRVGPYGAAAGMAIICFSGPLAVWSNSSLETAPFALGVTVLLWALVAGRDGIALASGAFLVLERIDGPVYAGALIAAFTCCSDAARRGDMLRRIVIPIAALLAVYHGWRYWYFGALVPPPLEAKVVYKLLHRPAIVIKAPRTPYIVGFAEMYGWIATAVFAAALAAAIRTGGALRAIALSFVALITYVATVGDWMFGFRFLVPLVPMVGLVCGALVTAITVRNVPVGVAMCVACVTWSAVTGVRFVSAYQRAERVEPFLSHPSRDLHRFFFPYYGLYQTARPLLSPRDIVAYNQAGFLPFMLDLSNIDDLGITSEFYARLPSTDIFFTEVGRYNPLTDKPELHAGEAYLVYRNVRYVIVRTDLLRSANEDTIPRELLGGYYELLVSDPEGENAIYRRTALAAGRFANDPRSFVENVAHVSYIRHARIDGSEVPPDEYVGRFPFLRDGVGRFEITGSTAIDVIFAGADEDVYELTVEKVRFDRPVSLEMLLFDVNRRPVFRRRIEIEPRVWRAIRIDLPPNMRASRFELQLAAGDDVTAHGSIEDLRVQGQTPALAKYIAQTLTFPAVR